MSAPLSTPSWIPWSVPEEVGDLLVRHRSDSTCEMRAGDAPVLAWPSAEISGAHREEGPEISSPIGNDLLRVLDQVQRSGRDVSFVLMHPRSFQDLRRSSREILDIWSEDRRTVYGVPCHVSAKLTEDVVYAISFPTKNKPLVVVRSRVLAP